MSLRKEIIHLENQLQGILELEERFARHKDKESVTVASLKQQIAVLKNKLKAVDTLDLDKKVDHLSFLLGEHLARKEVSGEVAITEADSREETPVRQQPEEDAETKVEEKTEERHQASLDTAKKAAMLQRRLDALKHELQIHRELETKKPEEMKLIEEKIQLFEEKLQQYYEHHPEAMLHEVGAVDVPPEDIKHTMLFSPLAEEIKDAEKQLPLPPPPRMSKRRE